MQIVLSLEDGEKCSDHFCVYVNLSGLIRVFQNCELTLNYTDRRHRHPLSSLPLSDNRISHLSLLSQPQFCSASLSVSGPPSLHPFCFTECLTFCLSPKAYCPIHLSSNLFPRLSPLWLLFFLSLSPPAPAFAIILGL